MVLVQEFCRPDLFITFTCNNENLKENESSADHPDLITRVFEGKLKSLLKDLTENNILGRVIAYTYVIEFQNRDYSHTHILLWLHEDFKIKNSANVDQLVCAEIPDPNEHLTLSNHLNHIIHKGVPYFPNRKSYNPKK